MMAAALLILAGCSSIYKKDTNCPGYLETGQCYDLLEAYEASHDFDRDEYRRKLRAHGKPQKGKKGKKGKSPELAAVPVMSSPPQPMMVSDDQPMPILTPAVTVRVFVDPYQDREGRLHTPGYVYVRAKEPEWIFGSDQTKRSRVASPLARDN